MSQGPFLPAWFTSPALRLPARCLPQLHMLRPSLPAGGHGTERRSTPATWAPASPPPSPARAQRRCGRWPWLALPAGCFAPLLVESRSPTAITSSECWDHPSRTPIICPPLCLLPPWSCKHLGGFINDTKARIKIMFMSLANMIRLGGAVCALEAQDSKSKCS